MKKRKIVALVCVATVLLLAVSAFWYVQTKLDKINRSQIAKQVKLVKQGLGVDKDTIVIPFSAETKQGREEIWNLVDQILASSGETDEE